MPKFFGERITQDLISLSPEDSHHALRVLRLRPGDTVRVSAQGLHFNARLEVDHQQVRARILDELASNEARTRITLYQGWPKGDKLDQIVRQSTELGVAAFVPVLFARCVARPDQAGKRLERLNKIAREAAMQSERTIIPPVLAPISAAELPTRLQKHALALVLYENERHQTLASVLNGQADLALVIGPEGGLTAEEVAAMGAQPVTLGPRVLRTETAGIAAIAMALALNRDF
ncbi:MAG: RsmE family RNA methyltransferase [Christensenellales bacterium]|jgi:16S rRNA (uracil1498-N3)-methyltransferase